MSGTDTTRILRVYEQQLERPRFFSSKFETPPQNFHDDHNVEFDIVRQGQDIAVAVPNRAAGPRLVEVKKYQNQSLEPITFKYEARIGAHEIKKRMAGQSPYESPAANAAAIKLALREARKIETMIRDATEQFCAQILTTGTLTATDENGDTVAGPYNFFPLDATGTLASGDLIVTTDTEWAEDGSTGNPLSDMQTLDGNVRARGYNPTEAYYGSSAWQRFIANSDVKDQANFRRINTVDINPAPTPAGAIHMGRFMINENPYDCFVYNGTYKAPNGGASTRYLDSEKVVIRDPVPGGLELTFGEIDYFEQARDTRAIPFLPRQMNFSDRGFGLTMYAYFSPDAQTLVICAGTRVLPIAKAIDSFACIDVTP